MSPRSSPPKRVVLVERDSNGGLILERALAGRDMDVTRVETGRYLSTRAAQDCDAVLLVLDDDDTDIFDALVRISAQPRRPPVVLLTRRAHTLMLEPSMLASLGVDELLAWPCRVEEVAAAVDKAFHSHEPLRLVS